MSNKSLQNPQTLEEKKDALAHVIRFLASRGWSPGTGGNFSVVIDTAPLTLLMSPSGIDKGEVTADQLIVVNESGEVIQGSGKASAETLIHIFLCKHFGARSVLHTHSVWNTIFSRKNYQQKQVVLAGFEMLKALGTKNHETELAVPIFDNDQDISRFVGQLEAQKSTLTHKNAAPAFLMRGHGLYSWGDSLYSAKRHIEALEFLFEVAGNELLLGDI